MVPLKRQPWKRAVEKLLNISPPSLFIHHITLCSSLQLNATVIDLSISFVFLNLPMWYYE